MLPNTFPLSENSEPTPLFVPFKEHEARQLSIPVILFQFQYFLSKKEEIQPGTCSWCEVTTGLWSAINMLPLLFSVPFLKTCLAFPNTKPVFMQAAHAQSLTPEW